MANPPVTPPNANDPNCRVNDTTQPPINIFQNDGAKTNTNIQNGAYVPPNYQKGTLDLSTSECAENDSNYMASLMAEALNIAAGPVNVFPMLGVHNQGSTLDQPGVGNPVSGGTAAGYNTTNAFTAGVQTAWRSVQTGAAVITAPAYLGYDFGTLKAWPPNNLGGTERTFPSTAVRQQISTLKIKQGSDPGMRCTQIRVEASDDNVTWYRVDVLNAPDVATLVTLGIRSNAAYRSWRLVPSFFSGVAANKPWEVLEVHFLQATQISLDNIEDFELLENRARAYCHSSTMLKCTYDLLDVQSELAKFGINLPQTYIFTTSFADMVVKLGRPVVVGDIVELPGEIQFDPNLKPVRKWLEVTDAGWSTDGYTPNWRPNLFRFYAQPILPAIEQKDLLGVPGQVNEATSDSDFLLNSLLQNDQAFKSTEEIKQASAIAVSQTGEDPQDIQSGKPLLGPTGAYDGNDLYAEDALPPNGAAYTYGDALPTANTIADGHYHRQTYTNVNAAIRPPDRLLRWFASTQRWKVIEINSRVAPESHKKTIGKIISSTTRINPDDKM
jgi:hypothetical protein